MQIRRDFGRVVAAAAMLTILSSGCATIMHGTKQTIRFRSEPVGALVTINGEDRGFTPVAADLKRRHKEHLVRIELDGYEPFEMTLERKLSAWYFGNFVFGGLVGLVVDPSTGAIFRIGPEEKKEMLAARGATVDKEEGKLRIRVALVTDPGAEQIGSLLKSSSR